MLRYEASSVPSGSLVEDSEVPTVNLDHFMRNGVPAWRRHQGPIREPLKEREIGPTYSYIAVFNGFCLIKVNNHTVTPMKKEIDLITDFQKISVAQIREAVLRERTDSGEIIFEVLFWSAYFEWILFSYPDYESLPHESIIYKYRWSILHGEEVWGDEWNGEVEIDRLEEFYGHLKNIRLSAELIAKKEYAAMLEICESAIQNGNRLFFMADY